ncbi:MAG: hypothetical protein M9939_21840 [Mesorhizobium sp.]|nr:hypothetical protein [Mesorhizobium sp.]MCO5163777.1 hypothetical protein [Mesorhizobium sp.]
MRTATVLFSASVALGILHVQSSRAEETAPTAVNVTIKVYSARNRTLAVPSKVYRKKLGGSKEFLANTNSDGVLQHREPECDFVYYAAESLHPNVFPLREDWRQCSSNSVIDFAMAPSGVSQTAFMLLEGQTPEGFVLPQGYDVVLQELKEAQDRQEWGAVAKLSSHLAAQYRAAGYASEANAFSEISLATAAQIAAPQTTDSVSSPLLTADKHGTPILTLQASKYLKAFQQECGIPVDGQVGWTTMGCLPGGAGYTLPKETALFPLPDAGDTSTGGRT